MGSLSFIRVAMNRGESEYQTALFSVFFNGHCSAKVSTDLLIFFNSFLIKLSKLKRTAKG